MNTEIVHEIYQYQYVDEIIDWYLSDTRIVLYYNLSNQKYLAFYINANDSDPVPHPAIDGFLDLDEASELFRDVYLNHENYGP